MSDDALALEDLAEMAESDPLDPGEADAGEMTPDAAGDGGGSSAGSSIGDLLLSTEPDLSPRDARGVFALDVSPADHLEVALAKMTESGGTPAGVHLALAVILAVGGDVLEDDDADGSDDGATGGEIDAV